MNTQKNEAERMVMAEAIIKNATKIEIETSDGTLYIFNFSAAAPDGTSALIIKCTGEGRMFDRGSFYWGVAVANTQSMGASSETAPTAERAAVQYTARCM